MPQAYAVLGKLLERGFGAPADLQAALQWCQYAQRLGVAPVAPASEGLEKHVRMHEKLRR